MAKPIILIKIPIEPFESVNETLRAFKSLHKSMPDYYVLIIVTGVEEIELSVFYEKDFDQVKYDELKQIITDLNKSK